MSTLIDEYFLLEGKLFEARKGDGWTEQLEDLLQAQLFELYSKLVALDQAIIENRRDGRKKKNEIVGVHWENSLNEGPIQIGQVVVRNEDIGLLYCTAAFGPFNDQFLKYSSLNTPSSIPPNFYPLPKPIPAPHLKYRYTAIVASRQFLDAMPRSLRNGMLVLDGAVGWEFAIGTPEELGRRLRKWITYLRERRAKAFSIVPGLLDLKGLFAILNNASAISINSVFPTLGKEFRTLPGIIQSRLSPQRNDVKSSGVSTWSLTN